MALPYALGILLYSVAWRSYRYGTGVMIAAICDTLLLPPIFALCTAPGFQCRFSRRTHVPRRRRLTSCWTRSCYLVPLPLTVLLALRPGVFDGNMTLPLGQHQAAPLRIARPAKCLDCRKRGLSFSCPQPAASSLRAAPRCGAAARCLLASCGPAATCVTTVI